MSAPAFFAALLAAAAVFPGASSGQGRASAPEARPILPPPPDLDPPLAATPYRHTERVFVPGLSRSRILSINALPHSRAPLRRSQFSGWREGRSPQYSFLCGRERLVFYHFVWWHSGAYTPPGSTRARGRYLYGLRLIASTGFIQESDGLQVTAQSSRVETGSPEEPVPSVTLALTFQCRVSDGDYASQGLFRFRGDGGFESLDGAPALR